MYYIYITIYIMYELYSPDFISSLDDGIENPTQTISIGDSLLYEKNYKWIFKSIEQRF